MKKGFLKNSEKVYTRAQTAVIVFLIGIIASFFSSIPVLMAGLDTQNVVDKYKQTDDYKTKVVTAVDEVIEDFQSGEIDSVIMANRISDIKSSENAEKLLKESGDEQLISEYNESNEALNKSAIGAGAVVGTTMGAGIASIILINKIHKKQEKEAEEAEENIL